MDSKSKTWAWTLTLCAVAGVTTQARAEPGDPCWSDEECGEGAYCAPTDSDGGEGGTGGTNGGSGGTNSGSIGSDDNTGGDPASTTGGVSSNNGSGSGGGSAVGATTGGVSTNGSSSSDGALPDPADSGGGVDLAPPSGTCASVPDYWCETDEQCTFPNYCDADCLDGALCEPRAERFGGCQVLPANPDEACGSGGEHCPSGLSCVATVISGGGDSEGNSTTELGGPECVPTSCADDTACDDGFECVAREGSGTGGSDGNGDPIPVPVEKQCEVKRDDCDSAADCAEGWECVELTNVDGGLASPARWGEVGAIKNCYPSDLAAYAETIAGLPTAPRINPRLPGESTGGGEVDGSTNGEVNAGANEDGSGGTGGNTGDGNNGGGNNGGGATGGSGTGQTNGGDNGATSNSGNPSQGTSSNGGGSTDSSENTGTKPVEHGDDCSVGGGLSGVGGAWLMLALSSLVTRRKRRA